MGKKILSVRKRVKRGKVLDYFNPGGKRENGKKGGGGAYNSVFYFLNIKKSLKYVEVVNF